MLFDWSSDQKKFILDTNSEQFSVSNYKGFLSEAARFLADTEFDDYAKYLKTYADTKFTKPVVQNPGEYVPAEQLDSIGY